MEKHTSVMLMPESAKVAEIKEKINLKDSMAVISYGAAAQQKSSEFVDRVLSVTRTNDFGESGEMLASLVVSIKSFDAEAQGGNFITRFFYSAKSRIEKIQKSYAYAEKNIDAIVDNLEKHRRNLMQDVSMLDAMYNKTVDYLNDLENYIQAGDQKIMEMNKTVLPEMKKNLDRNAGQLEIQEYRDTAEALNRFEKRIHDLKLTKSVTLQLLPQIRLQQTNNSILVDKINSSIVNSIPLWKSQMIIALSLSHTQSALSAQKAVTEATNEMLRRNSEMLKIATVETAKEAERPIIDINAIKKANDDIVSAIRQVTAIQKESRLKRRDAEKEIELINAELKENIKKALMQE